MPTFEIYWFFMRSILVHSTYVPPTLHPNQISPHLIAFLLQHCLCLYIIYELTF